MEGFTSGWTFDVMGMDHETCMSGDFAFTHPTGLRVARGMNEAEAALFSASPPEHLGNGFNRYLLPQGNIEGSLLKTELCFHHGKLAAVGLRVAEPVMVAAGGWEAWGETEERACVKRTEKWLRQSGYKPGNYRWCEIRVGYDSHSGSGGGFVRFHQ